jgi:hypothetical protein
MKVKDAMHKSVDWVSPDIPVIEARKNDARVLGVILYPTTTHKLR